MADKTKQDSNYDTLTIGDSVYKTKFTSKFNNRKPFKHPKKGEIHAFIPGTIIKVSAKVGDTVEKGQILLILEAMKMNNRITAPITGTIKKMNVKVGDIVTKNQLLVVIK